MSEQTYHAVVKLHESDAPKRITYKAVGVGPAIVYMAKICKVASTADIYEFEILEVVGRDQYKRVAMKLPTKSKPHVKVETKLDTSKLSDNKFDETPYNPYSLKVA